MRRAEEVGLAINARFLEFDNALDLLIGVRAIDARLPTAAFLVRVTCKPVNNGRTPKPELAGNLRIVFPVFGKSVRFLKIFSLPLVS